jgi:glycosyltransferase involved in cell wall biosynthesis
MRLLARRNDIIWVNYRGTRRPKATTADLRAAVTTLGHVRRGAQRVAPGLVTVTPFVLPGVAHPLLQKINGALLTAQVRRVVRRVRSNTRRPIQLWTFAPDVACLAGTLGEERLIYYCVDEYTEFQGFDGPAIARAEQALIDRADTVITTSAALFAAKRPRHPNVHLVRHGVDANHFRRALEPDLTLPADLAAIPSPRLGFFGWIHHWIDCRLIGAVARLRPDYSFVLIGTDDSGDATLRDLPNVYLMGQRPYAALPAYCRGFDAALLPFACTRMTRNVNPIKLREYLAAGLPVVSTPLPEAVAYQPDVLLAREPDAFARACDEAIARSTPTQRRARSRRVAGETWEAVVERLACIIEGIEPAAARPAMAVAS